jgi:hypothetical protein
VDKNIEIDFFKSYLSQEDIGDGVVKIILALVWPITIVILLKNKNLQLKQMTKVFIFIILALGIFGIGANVYQTEVDYYNKSQQLDMSFTKKLSERLTVLDRMNKKLSNKMQIAGIIDSSYYKNLVAVTISKKDGVNLMWKWARENNPNINFNEVSQFYIELIATVESERNSLLSIENDLQNVKMEYDLLHNTWPSKIYLYYQTKQLNYIPIASDDDRTTNLTGVDNNYKIK